MEDSQIVALYWNREEAAVDHTQRKYGRYLEKIAYNILYNWEDSQESLNDTYLAAWNSMPPHKPNRLSAYLGKLTRRISIDLFRKKNADKRSPGQYVLSLEELGECVGSNTAEEQLELQMLSDAITRYLREQTAETRQIFIARYYYMDSVKEIARYCRISESKVKGLLYRTRQGLRKHLKEEGFAV